MHVYVYYCSNDKHYYAVKLVMPHAHAQTFFHLPTRPHPILS